MEESGADVAPVLRLRERRVGRGSWPICAKGSGVVFGESVYHVVDRCPKTTPDPVADPGDLRFEGQTAESAVTRVKNDPACMMVNRNQGSGTRILIDRLLDGAKPPGYAVQSRSHNGVVAAVVQGRADWGVAISGAAQRGGLGFLPLTEERYDFVVPAGRVDRPAIERFRDLLDAPDVRRAWKNLGLT
ncbi:MAG: hypothetical protein EA424_07785 [Planctomycetaceae bacterium]|nr:MAG: hypothetical protein EA424_07785 [Planctomycetaceae bacterium]